MKYRFLGDDERQGLRYEIAQSLERQHYRLELQLRQLRRVAPEASDIKQSEEQQQSIEAQIDAVLEEDVGEPR